eukprot:5452579-Pyramimonas_sp.AAC.1
MCTRARSASTGLCLSPGTLAHRTAEGVEQGGEEQRPWSSDINRMVLLRPVTLVYHHPASQHACTAYEHSQLMKQERA